MKRFKDTLCKIPSKEFFVRLLIEILICTWFLYVNRGKGPEALECILFDLIVVIVGIEILLFWGIKNRISIFFTQLLGGLANEKNAIYLCVLAPLLYLASINGFNVSTHKNIMWPMVLIVFGCTVYICKNNTVIKNILDDERKKKALYIVDLFITFAMVGSNCFVYPIDQKLSMGSIMCFCISLLWNMPISIMIWHMINAGEYIQNKLSEKKVILICVSILIVFCGFYLYKFYPCISSYDTVQCVKFALTSMNGMDDWHPPFYVFILKVILKIFGGNVFGITLLQAVFYIYVFTEGIRLLYKKGIDYRLLFFGTILTSLIPSNMILVVTVWKDVLYAVSLLWLVIILGNIVTEGKKNIGLYIKLITSLVLICMMRQNGIVVFIISSVMLIIVCREKRIMMSIIISIMLIILIKGPLYSYWNINSNPNGGEYIGLGHDILGVYYAGGQLSNETKDVIVDGLTFGNPETFPYVPYWSYSSYDLNISKIDFIKCYLHTFINNPVKMTRSVLCRIEYLWNVLPTDGFNLDSVCYLDDMSNDEYWLDVAPRRTYNLNYGYLTDYFDLATSTDFLKLFTWRGSVWSVFVIVCFVTNLVKRNKKVLLIFAPWISQFVSIMLSTGWSEFRYCWPLIISSYFLIALTYTESKKVE